MPTQSKETTAAKKRSTAKQSAKQTKEKSTAPKTTTRKKTARKTADKKATAQAIAAKKQTDAEPVSQQTMLAIPEENIASAIETDSAKTDSAMEAQAETTVEDEVSEEMTPAAPLETADSEDSRQLVSKIGTKAGYDRTFLASQLIQDDIWAPNAAIPTLDEATYAAQKAQAEAQRRAIEIASLNLQNMNELHQLEQQRIGVAISAKNNETRNAQLAAAGIDYQTQLETNGEKSQHLAQAAAKHQAATRESGYTDQLIALKDKNFELEIQQAQSVFAEKAARYRAQLTGQ